MIYSQAGTFSVRAVPEPEPVPAPFTQGPVRCGARDATTTYGYSMEDRRCAVPVPPPARGQRSRERGNGNRSQRLPRTNAPGTPSGTDLTAPGAPCTTHNHAQPPPWAPTWVNSGSTWGRRGSLALLSGPPASMQACGADLPRPPGREGPYLTQPYAYWYCTTGTVVVQQHFSCKSTVDPGAVSLVRRNVSASQERAGNRQTLPT